MHYRVPLIVVLATSLAFVGTASAIFIPNADFELGTLAGWSQSGNTGFTGVSGGSFPHHDNYGLVFGPTSPGYVYQNLSTAANGVYDLNFYLSKSGNGEMFQVWWDNTLIYNNAAPACTWEPMTLFTFTGLVASSASTELRFGAANWSYYYYIDDVGVEEDLNTVPEPASFVLLGIVLGLGTVLTRRRKHVRLT